MSTPITIAILEDGVLAGQYTAEEIRAANLDCPDVDAAIRCLEAGAYQAELRLGAGGVTLFVVVEPCPFTSGASDVVEVRARVVKAIHAPRGKAPPRRRALASYRGTLEEVRAASDAEIAFRRQLLDCATLAAEAGIPHAQCFKTEAEVVDAVEGRR